MAHEGKFSDSDATRIITALDRRAQHKMKNNATVHKTWGTVGEVDAYNKVASAYLHGESDGAYMSVGFRIPETAYVTVGDVVKVAINYTTDERWVDEVKVPASDYKKLAFNLSTGQILTGDGTAPPVASIGVPTGSITMYGAASAPSGWLLCDGTAVSRSTYDALFAIVGTTFGVGDGSTTFNLPNMKSRFPVGLDAANARWNVLGETGGSETHTHASHSNLTHDNNHSGGAVSAHSGTSVGNHGNLSHTNNHSGTAVATHGDHVHDTPFIDNGPQTLSTTQSFFGTGTSRTRVWTGSYSGASGSYAVARTSGNITGGTSTSHTVTQPSAHADHTIDAHSVTQPSNHSFTQPSAHSDHSISAHDSPASVPPYIALNFIIKV